MVKRSSVVVALSLFAILAVPALASASHWAPPPWWQEVVASGEHRPSTHGDDTCEVRTYPYSGSTYDHYHMMRCTRGFPTGGIAECTAAAWWDTRYGYACEARRRYAWSENTYSCRANLTEFGDEPDIEPWLRQPTRTGSGSAFHDPDCFARIRDGRPDDETPPDRDRDGVADPADPCPDVAGPSNGCPAPTSDEPSGAAGHDLVSLCGTARFGWYRSNFGDPDVEKGEEACIHTVSNRVAQQLVAQGLKEMPELFGRRLVDWAKGQLVPDPEDLIQRALPAWDRAFRTAGRLNVITRIGEAVGVSGVALGYTFAANQIANKDACVMFITSTPTNLSVAGTGSSSFEVDGWQMVYNRKNVKHPKRDAELHTANVSQKYKRRLRRDKWETRMTSMRCGKGGKVFLTAKHDESKIVSGRVRAAG